MIDLEAALAAWERSDDAALLASSGAVVLARAALDALLTEDASSRAKREILTALADALAHDAGIAFRVWPRETDYHGVVCVAAIVGEQLVAHVAEGVKPSEAWSELRPWYRELGRNRAKIDRWAQQGRVAFALGARPQHETTGQSEAELIAQIVEHPDDPAPRAVLADLLLERGDVRGECIARENTALEAQHRLRLAGEIADHCESFGIVRGFVDSVTMTAGAYRKHGERLFAAQPIRELCLRPYNERAVETLSKAPHLPRLRALALHGKWGHEGRVTLIPLCGVRLERLEELDLKNCMLVAAAGVPLEKLDAPRLRTLQIRGSLVATRALRGLADNRALCDRLEHFELDAPRTFAESTNEFAGIALPRLRVLRAMSPLLSDDHVAAIVRGAPIEDAALYGGLDALAEKPMLRRLYFMGRYTLLDSLPWPRLERFVILRGPLGADECERIANMLIALPAEHPLRDVEFRGYEHPGLRERFPR